MRYPTGHKDRTLPVLASDIAREGRAPRAALKGYLQRIVAELAPRTPPAPGLSPEDRVLATVALLSRSLMLPRAIPDPALSDRILRAARRLAVPETAEAASGGAGPVPESQERGSMKNTAQTRHGSRA